MRANVRRTSFVACKMSEERFGELFWGPWGLEGGIFEKLYRRVRKKSSRIRHRREPFLNKKFLFL